MREFLSLSLSHSRVLKIEFPALVMQMEFIFIYTSYEYDISWNCREGPARILYIIKQSRGNLRDKRGKIASLGREGERVDKSYREKVVAKSREPPY